MNEKELRILLNGLQDGSVTIDKCIEEIKKLPCEELDFAKIDFHRNLRNGFPEVIYCEGKTSEQILKIVEKMYERGVNILATRIDSVKVSKLKEKIPEIVYYENSKIACIKLNDIEKTGGIIGVLTAGTADIAVAEEAAVTSEFFGSDVIRIYDVGVAGIHRLLSRIDKIRDCDVIITVAGMEGALASVVGGLVDVPVIAVPTSIGYGSSFGGLSALLTMLNSCASGVGVVNIDNGFGAGYLASTIIKSGMNRRKEN